MIRAAKAHVRTNATSVVLWLMITIVFLPIALFHVAATAGGLSPRHVQEASAPVSGS